MAITRATNLAGLGTVFNGDGLNVSGVVSFSSFVGVGSTSGGSSPMISIGGTIRSFSPLTGFGSTPVTFVDIYPNADVPRIHFEENGLHSMEIGYRGDSIISRPNLGEVRVVRNSPLVFSTNNTERVRILSSGGITFNGDTAAANALDDYEEGTWTPTDTSTGVTFSSSDGKYFKVGSIVVAYGNVQFPVNSNGLSVGITLPVTAGGGRPGGFIRYTNSSLYFSLHVNAGAASVTPYLNTGAAVANSQMSNKRLDFEVIYSTENPT